MFDAIAPRYDLLNHVLSAGLDRRWRDRAVDALALDGRARVLDLCTGTCDLAVAAVRRGRAASVVGIDFAGEMLRLGRTKVRQEGLDRTIRLVRGDAARIPLDDGSCDAATIGFGIRNVAEPEKALAEIVRVLRAGGWPSWNSVSRASPASGRCTRGISATCCRSSAGWCRSTRARIRTCRPRSGRFPPRPSLRAHWLPRDFHRCGPSL